MIQALIGTKLLLGLVSGFKEMPVKGGNGTAALSPALEMAYGAISHLFKNQKAFANAKREDTGKIE